MAYHCEKAHSAIQLKVIDLEADISANHAYCDADKDAYFPPGKQKHPTSNPTGELTFLDAKLRI